MPNTKPKAHGPVNFYRLARDWHGYLSAFAFTALIFFAATGILLNHPGLLAGPNKPLVQGELKLDPEQAAALKNSRDPGLGLVRAVSGRMKLAGRLKSADADGPNLFVRLQGVRGSSDLRADLDSGVVEVTVERAGPTAILNGLHRGETAGKVWRFWIDAVAASLLVSAILGYILFFSLRFRLKTALVLTTAGLVLMVGLYLAFVS